MVSTDGRVAGEEARRGTGRASRHSGTDSRYLIRPCVRVEQLLGAPCPLFDRHEDAHRVSSSVVILAEAASRSLEGRRVDLGEVVVTDDRGDVLGRLGLVVVLEGDEAELGDCRLGRAELGHVDRLAVEGLRHRHVAGAERRALLRRIVDAVLLERALAERVRVAVRREAPLELVLAASSSLIFVSPRLSEVSLRTTNAFVSSPGEIPRTVRPFDLIAAWRAAAFAAPSPLIFVLS